MLAAIVLKDKRRSQRILGMLISFSGIILIAGQVSLSKQLSAILLTGAGAMMGAVGQTMVKRLEIDHLDLL